MASIVKLSRGKQPPRAIDFVMNGQRKRVRLGKILHDDARAAKRGIERLLICQQHGLELDADTAKWLTALSNEIHSRIARHGLCAGRIQKDESAATLAAFIDRYIESRAIEKPNTLRNYKVTRDHLVGFFGENKLLAAINSGDADDWRQMLLKQRAAATVSREVKRAKQFFRAAERKEIIAKNPFADLPTPAQVNTSRQRLVTRETIEKVIDACPDAEWRLIVALARYGGLRCPSELLTLRWIDVNWEDSRLTIRSSKTEHHPGRESRTIPMFPEIRRHLEVTFDEAEEGAEYVINRYRTTNTNLRTQLQRIIKRAGVEPWPKPFNNLRSSCETDLCERFPIHVVTAWLGNTTEIAIKHYLQVTNEHFRSAAESAADSQQKAQQQDVTPTRTDSQDRKESLKNRERCAPPQVGAKTGEPTEHPLGESNPCLRTENPMSWATRRRGRAQNPRKGHLPDVRV